MKTWSFVALLVVGATVLGSTVLREPIAYAAQSVSATIVGPLDGNGNVAVHEQGTANVREQNLDANGNVKVHEQGTAQVSPTLPPDANFSALGGGLDSPPSQSYGRTIDATLIDIDMGSNAVSISFFDGERGSLFLWGPGAFEGQAHYVLPLTQPIPVDRWQGACVGNQSCIITVNIVGSIQLRLSR
jgi:hypothetical protein